jgi:hypothetical protein
VVEVVAHQLAGRVGQVDQALAAMGQVLMLALLVATEPQIVVVVVVDQAAQLTQLQAQAKHQEQAALEWSLSKSLTLLRQPLLVA